MKPYEKFIDYALPCWDDEEIESLKKTVESNWWSKGPQTVEFEKQFAQMVGAKYAVAMNSCTAGLHIALLAHKIGEGDEVIVPAMTFCASANTSFHAGATPVLVDVDEKTSLIDPDKIEEAITERTKAIVPVHYAGQACDMDKIEAIAKKHNLIIIEDAAHAVHTKYKGTPIGGRGNTASFSFYATKNLATGEGGMMTTDDQEVAALARTLSLHGMNRNAWNRFTKEGSWYYEVEQAGYKYNMTDFQAGLGLSQMKKLDAMQAKREEYAKIYNEAIDKIDGISRLEQCGYGTHAWHLYVIRIDNSAFTIDRSEFIEELTALNIGTSVHYVPLHMHPVYRDKFGYKPEDFPNALKLYEEIISIPLYPSMTESEVNYVVEALQFLAKKYAK